MDTVEKIIEKEELELYEKFKLVYEFFLQNKKDFNQKQDYHLNIIKGFWDLVKEKDPIVDDVNINLFMDLNFSCNQYIKKHKNTDFNILWTDYLKKADNLVVKSMTYMRTGISTFGVELPELRNC